HPIVAIDDCRNAVVGADLEELRLELLVFADVDRMCRIGQAELFERNGSLAAVRRGPGIKIDHGRPSLFVGSMMRFCGLKRLATRATSPGSASQGAYKQSGGASRHRRLNQSNCEPQ